MAETLKRTAVRLSMRLGGPLDYFMKLPIKCFMDIVEEVIKIDEERRRGQV